MLMLPSTEWKRILPWSWKVFVYFDFTFDFLLTFHPADIFMATSIRLKCRTASCTSVRIRAPCLPCLMLECGTSSLQFCHVWTCYCMHQRGPCLNVALALNVLVTSFMFEDEKYITMLMHVWMCFIYGPRKWRCTDSVMLVTQCLDSLWHSYGLTSLTDSDQTKQSKTKGVVVIT